ncbi:cytochrome P450 monooxygenase afumB [Aspergillus stella-maris]|uniref:cytochrome P450 monooxygenase afumB n=1 Tax=Aspergillus stella-maris TaxID=1810926 RepID=UPI003CCDB75F
MMVSGYIAAFTLAFYYTILYTLECIKQWKLRSTIAKKHDCAKPAAQRPWDILGLFNIYPSIKHFYRKAVLDNMSASFTQYGDTYSSRILHRRVYITRDPCNIRHILVTAFADFNSVDVRAHLFRPIAGESIFVQDGEHWKAVRALYTDMFSRARQLFSSNAQEAGFQALLQSASTGPGDQHAVELQQLFLKLILDVNSMLAMGVGTDALSPFQTADKKQFVESLIHAKRVMARNAFLGPLHHLLGKKDFQKACRNVKDFVERVVKDEFASRSQRIQIQANNKEITSKPEIHTNLQQLMLDKNNDIDHVRDEIVLVLIAGTDSVASLLSSTFYFLARHETVYAKLRKEIIDTFDTEKPTYEMLRKIPYLSHIFNEAMRLIAPVPINARTANRDTWLPSGGGKDGKSAILVHKGENVIYSSWASHRSTKTFGADAHEFRPERWEARSLRAEPALGYIPFSMGPRVCPGQQYALLQASYITIRIVQTYSQIRNRDARPWTEKIDLNLFNKHGVLVDMVPAEEDAREATDGTCG